MYVGNKKSGFRYLYLCSIILDGNEKMESDSHVSFLGKKKGSFKNEKECFLLLSGSINKLEAIPDLVSRIKKMETLRLEAINDDELLEATKAISKNLNIEISDKNMNYLINNSKRDIKTIFRTLSQLEKESLERKKSIGLNLIKEVIQNS